MKDKKLEIRVSEAEYAQVKAWAGKEGISNFVRTKIGLDGELSGQDANIVRTNKKIEPEDAPICQDKPKEVEPVVRTKHPTCEKHGHTPVQRGSLWVCALCGSKLKKREA